jgi:hypothetical protein
MSANDHPAKIVTRPPRRPVEGEDGFGRGHVHDQRVRVWRERDAPLAQRKDKA